MKNEEISRLVRMVQNKEDGSFERLYQEIWEMIFGYCRKQLGSHQDAEDAAQEIIFKFYNAINKIQSPDAANMFLCRTMSNVCVDTIRRQKAQPAECNIDDTDETVFEEDKEFLPDEMLLHKELRQQVAGLVDELPEKQREAVMLYYFSGLKQAEISEVTNSDLNAVNNRLVKARKTLRRQADELLSKGQWSHTMGATPILTQILQDDCDKVCTPQICDRIWRGVSDKIGLNPEVPLPDIPQNTAAEAPGKAATEAASQSSGLLNAGITVAITATIVVAGILGTTVWRSYSSPEPTPTETAMQAEEVDGIIAALKKVKNKSDFDAFRETYGFDASETIHHEDGLYQLYIGIAEAKQLRVGSRETESGEFSITYEITDLTAETPDNVREWFLSKRP